MRSPPLLRYFVLCLLSFFSFASCHSVESTSIRKTPKRTYIAQTEGLDQLHSRITFIVNLVQCPFQKWFKIPSKAILRKPTGPNIWRKTLPLQHGLGVPAFYDRKTQLLIGRRCPQVEPSENRQKWVPLVLLILGHWILEIFGETSANQLAYWSSWFSA